MKVVVIYQSKYGTTKQYAEWIAEELGAELMEKSSVKPAMLADYDVVVYGGGLFAGGISGVDIVVKNACKKLVLFTVGLADPNVTDYSHIINKNLPPQIRDEVKVFHFRGGINYKNLKFVDKIMMSMMKKMILKKPDAERSDDDKSFLDTYGKKINFSDRETIKPLVNYLKNLSL